MFTFILVGIAGVIMAVGLIWTYKIGSSPRQGANEKMNSAVARHTVLLNPVFLAILLFSVVIVIMIYVASFLY